MEEIPTLDYHRSDEFGPTLLAFGHFIVDWNWAEQMFNALLWQFSSDMNVGAAFSLGLGNQTRAETLLTLASRSKAPDDIVELVKFAAKAFNRLRSNRNVLVHAHSITKEADGQFMWTRASKSPKHTHLYVLASEKDVIDNLYATGALATLCVGLGIYFNPNAEEKSFPSGDEMFEIPRLLESKPLNFELPQENNDEN